MAKPDRHVRAPLGVVDRISTVLPLLLIVNFFATACLVSFGAQPSRSGSDVDITLPHLIMREPTDRWVLIAWWALGIGVLLLTWTACLRLASPLLASGLQLTAPALLLFGIYVEHDQTGIFADDSWRRPFVGAAALVALLALAALAARPWIRGVRKLLILGVLLAATASFVMTPAGIRDLDSFRYTADELLAPAVGAFPYSNFAPQYSALLGYPVSALASLLPSHAIQVVLLAVLLMQVTTALTALWLLRSIVPCALLPLAACLLLAPIILTSPDGYSAGSYHANLPLRLFLPTILFAYAYRLLRHDTVSRTRQRSDYLGLGLLAGISALNNPEFGVPAAISILIVLYAAQVDRRAASRSVGLVSLGAVASGLVLVVLMAMAGRVPSSQSILVFQRIFGAVGFNAWPMPGSGLSLMFVSAFAAAAIAGVTILRHGRVMCSSAIFDAALQLALVGVWSLLSLPYYAGRSLTPTLLSGFGMQLGWILAASLPLLGASLREVRDRGARFARWQMSTLISAAIMMAIVLGMLTSIFPSIYAGAASAGGVAPANLEKQVMTLRALHLGPDVDQLLDMPASTTLLSGVPSHAVVSSPAYLQLSRKLAAMQCERGWPRSIRQVILEASTLRSLRLLSVCTTRLVLESAVRLPVAQNWWLVQLRSPAMS